LPTVHYNSTSFILTFTGLSEHQFISGWYPDKIYRRSHYR
jgi:hypothetical protein